MSRDLRLFNRQRSRLLDLHQLRRMTLHLLADLLKARQFDLVIQFVGSKKMARFNERYLRHLGTTDVITLDYSDGTADQVVGEIFICVDEACAQAKLFRTSWRAEVLRYIVHGVLHLRGHDDLRPAARRRMKREEDLLLKKLLHRFGLSKPAKKPKVVR